MIMSQSRSEPPKECPLRVDFCGAWLDVPKLARDDAYIVNCAITPLVSLDNWPYEIGGGLAGSTAHAILTGDDPMAYELDSGAGWQDPAVLDETGLCVWKSGPDPNLIHRESGKWFSGLLAILNTGIQHNTPSLVDRPRDYDAIAEASRIGAEAVHLHDLAAFGMAMIATHITQVSEGDPRLPEFGSVGRVLCGSASGGHGVYLFENRERRDKFVSDVEWAKAVEPYNRPPGTDWPA